MLKQISIDDFSGGKDLVTNQALLQNNQCASASYSVWNPAKMLTKMPGFGLFSTGYNSAGFTGVAGYYGLFVDDAVNTANTLYQRFALKSNNINANDGAGFYSLYPFIGTTVVSGTGYSTGTVSLPATARRLPVSATGVGTSWLTHITGSGDSLIIPGATATAVWSVSSVEDNTHITLASRNDDLATPALSGQSYQILTGFYTDVAFTPPNPTGTVCSESLAGSVYSFYRGQFCQRYDGTGMTRIQAAPAAAYCAVYQNYLFAANTVSAQSRVYWSAVRDGTSWPANNFVDVDQGRGVVNGLFATGQELLVFKSRSMFKIVGNVFDPSNPTYAVYPISVPNYFFFNSFDTVSSVNGIVYFFGQNRIYTYRPGTFYITDISQQIWPDLPNTFSAVSNPGSADASTRARGIGNYYVIKGLSYSGITATGLHGGIIDQNKSWWLFNDADATSIGGTQASFMSAGPMVVVPGTSSRSPTIVAASVNGFTALGSWDLLGPSFVTSSQSPQNGTTYDINSQWVSKEFNIEYGTFKWVVVYLQKQSAGNLTLAWSIDQGSYVSNTIDMTKGRGTIIRAVLPVNQKGTSIQLKINHSTAGQTFAIYGIKIYYEESPMERIL